MSSLLSLALFLALASEPATAHLRIGAIRLVAEDVYPPQDGNEVGFPYSWANALHLRTHDEVIRRELLFREGDPLRPELLAETERNLRRFPFFRLVRVEVEPPKAGVVDVTIHTIDAWTTKAQLNLGLSGGRLAASTGLVEDNLLGRGKRLSAFYILDPDRKSARFESTDPRVLGRFLSFTTVYWTGDDLKRFQIDFGHPFTATISPWAWGLSWDGQTSEEHLYEAGETSEDFRRTTRQGEAFLAKSLGSTPELVRRLYLGYRYTSTSFERAPDKFVDRLQSGPFAGLVWRQVSYIRERNINTYLRDEDYNLGAQAYLEAGWFPRALGSNRGELGWSLTASKGLSFREGQFALFNASVSGRDEHNLRSQLRLEYYHRFEPRFTFAASSQLDLLRDPDPDSQILLGGGQGLRGYKLRYFEGDKSILTRLEPRFLLVEDFLKVCSVGATAFLDVGRAWKKGRALSLDQAADAGVGLRLSFPRSSQARTMRFDVAYAFEENGLGSRWLFSFGAVQGF